MIRRLLCAAALSVAVNAYAAPVSFSFNAVPLTDFAQFTYRTLLHRDFVLSSELVGTGKKVTINVKGLDESNLLPFVDQLLLSQGIRSTERAGVFFLESASSSQAVLPPSVAASVAGDTVSPPDAPAPRHEAPAALPEPVEDKYLVVQAMNRPVEFLVTSLNAAFGKSVARAAGGSRFVLAGPEPLVDQVADLVKQLDVAAAVVEVSASFVEVTTNDASASGLSLVSSVLGGKMRASVTPADGQVRISAGRFELVMQALAGDGRFKQVSNSRVVGDEAEKLLLSVGEEVPTIASSSKDNAGNPVQNVAYKPSGVILDVVPRVLGSGRLSLVLDGQVSAFQSTTTGVAGSPTLVKRQVKTSVSVSDGEVLVIGGLNDSKATATAAGFSFLPAGWRSKSGQNTKTDLVLILSARVMTTEPKKAL